MPLRLSFLLGSLGLVLTLMPGWAAEKKPAPVTLPVRKPAPVSDGRVLTPEKRRVMEILANRTISNSRQFSVFSPDAALRSRVASFAEEVKTSLLRTLGEADGWKYPVIITLAGEQAPEAGGEPVSFSLYHYEGGFKVQIDVRIGEDPARVNLQKHLFRALLLENAYREHIDQLQDGAAFAEPPWWLVEGAAQIFLHREQGVGTDFFKRMVDLNRVPPVGRFLAGHPEDFAGSAVETMDQACAMCLVQLLLEQPSGKTSLATLVKHIPESGVDPVTNLLRDFPGLAKNEQSLQKWWTLNLARFSAADRLQGLTAAETDKQIQAALLLEIPLEDGVTRQTFALADYASYEKLKGHKEALALTQKALLTLAPQASALYQPLIAEYGGIVAALAKGKERGLKQRLAKAEEIRQALQKRMTDIGDYMNWYEATQSTTRSGKFDGYLRVARELDNPPPRQDPLSKFMDEAERMQ